MRLCGFLASTMLQSKVRNSSIQSCNDGEDSWEKPDGNEQKKNNKIFFFPSFFFLW